MDYGSTQKECPSCSTIVPQTAQICPRCAYAFGGGNAGTYIKPSGSPKGPYLLILKILVGCGASFVAFCLIAVLCFLHFPIAETDVYKSSLGLVDESREVQAILGSGIRVKSAVWGMTSELHGSKFAEWSVKVGGSRGEGHLYGVANRTRGVWEYSRLELVSEGGGQRVDLTPEPHALKLSPVPVKRVYLVPMALTQGESLDWVPAYYKAKLGIDVTILPPVAPDDSLVDKARDRLDSGKCIAFLKRTHLDLASDPFTILIGVTSDAVSYGSADVNESNTNNWREEGRFGILSTSRIRPFAIVGRVNPEWVNSRLQKLLSKNLLMLYFNYPLSADYTSLLSGGVLSGTEVDEMTGDIVGARGSWVSFGQSGEPSVSIYDVPGKPVLWNFEFTRQPVRDTNAQVFSADLPLGLLVQRKADFLLGGDFPLTFTRVYRTEDNQSRAFGVGGTNSLELYLVGQMGKWIELINEDGSRIHFNHDDVQHGQRYDTYLEHGGWSGPFAQSKAEYMGKIWRVTRRDRWTFFFPYEPEWSGQRVTILTSFTDAEGRTYEMKRDETGNLVDITTPSGEWLHLQNDEQHRITRITSSLGRTVDYLYDKGGRLIRVTDSDGHIDTYTYNDDGAMLTAGHGAAAKPVLQNEYFRDGYIKSQKMADGRKFDYTYFRGARNIINEAGLVDPNGLATSFQFYDDGYTQSLPTERPR